MSMRPDDHRRKWDKDEFEKIAAERLQAELDEEENSKKKGIKSVHFNFRPLHQNIYINIFCLQFTYNISGLNMLAIFLSIIVCIGK